MKANDFDSIFEKTFHELTDKERGEMEELFTNEEEFNQLKFVMHSVNATIRQQKQNNEPSAALKNRLDHLYTQTYRNKGILWYNSVGTFFVSGEKKWHQQNLLRIAALFVLFFTIYPFWNSDTLNNEKVQLSKNDTKQEESAAPQQQESRDQEKTAPSFAEPVNHQNKDLTVTDEVAKAPMEDLFDKLAEAEESKAEEMLVTLERVADDEKPTVTGSLTFSAHPDGVFMSDVDFNAKNSEFSVARHSDVLDILTATY
jgi:hypothetical protein